ncbi:MAG TPA: hypothetical protein VK968_05805, partial [Roseimicrobium sp.]|nr:hypothetical protein [Roseimicrobium sp.]
MGAGAATAFAVTTDGDLYAWGANGSKQFTFQTSPKWSSTPWKLPVTGVKNVTGGLGHVIALMQDGTVMSWGQNAYGQLGVGDQVDHGPQTIPNLNNVVQVAACGYRSFALKSDGTVWAWGPNGSSQLGVPGGGYVLSPTQVPGLALINSVSTSYGHAVAVRDDGMILTWGGNSVGQLGIAGVSPSYAGVSTPTPITGLPFLKHAAAAGDTTMASDVDGNLWVVGRTDGFSQGYSSTEWIQAPYVEKVVALAGGDYHNLAISQTETPIWLHFDPYTIVAGRTSTSLKLHIETPLDHDLVLPVEKTDEKLVVASSITIPAGSLGAEIPVKYHNRINNWKSPDVFIPSGGVRAAGSLSVSPDTLTLSFYDWPQAGDRTGGTLRINFPAPAGGFPVNITCEDPSAATFPASITIPEGKDVAYLPVQTTPSSTQRIVIFNVVGGPLSGTTDLVIRGNALGRIEFTPAEVFGGTKVGLKATLPDPAPAGGVTVNLIGINDQLVCPSSMIVPQGETTATILVGTKRQATHVSVGLTAYVAGSYPKVPYVKLLAATPLSLVPSDANPVGGSTVPVTLTLTGPSTGHTVQLVSTDPAVSVPATVSVAAGAKTVTFDAVTSTVTAPTSVTLKAKLNGGLATCTLHLKLPPPALQSLGI